MDLLGSILGSMEKPPENKEHKKAKERQAALEKLQAKSKEKLNSFRSGIQKRIGEFVKDGNLKNYKFEPMDKTCRAIVHEVADVAGLVAFSFGQEEVDRYIMLWKKEYPPSDDELYAYRNGLTWDPEAAAAAARLKEQDNAEKDQGCKKRKRKGEELPKSDYQRKYEHLLGTESARDAAKLTSANQSYGCVPSANKRDLRTIEEVMSAHRSKRSKGQGDVTDIVQNSQDTLPGN